MSAYFVVDFYVTNTKAKTQKSHSPQIFNLSHFSVPTGKSGANLCYQYVNIMADCKKKTKPKVVKKKASGEKRYFALDCNVRTHN